MKYIVHSEAGHEHINEDWVAVRRHPRDGEALICALADGQGGQFGGGAAARLAVQNVLDLASQREVESLWQFDVWRDIFRAVDKIIERDINAGFSTLIGLCAREAEICGASCGDGAAWLIGARAFDELTSAQRKRPPLGSGAAVPTAFRRTMPAASQLLLMSDGVWKFVGFEEILAATRESDGASLVQRLRGLQLDGNNGKLPDDSSLILLQ